MRHFRSAMCLGLLTPLLASDSIAQCPPNWVTTNALPGVDGAVNAITMWDPDGVGPDGEPVVLGGWFGVAGDVWANHVALWDGASWRSLGQNAPIDIRALAVYRGELYAGESFTPNYDPPESGICRWSGSAWVSVGGGLSADSDAYPTGTLVLHLHDDRLI